MLTISLTTAWLALSVAVAPAPPRPAEWGGTTRVCCLRARVTTAPAPRPVERVLATADKGIRLVTDRAETVPEFFRRHRAMSGGIVLAPIDGDPQRDLGMSLADVIGASAPVPRVMLAYPTWNTGEPAAYMGHVKVAPPSPAVAKLLREGLAEAEERDGRRSFDLDVVLREDDAIKGLWHLAGYTTRTFLFHENEALRYVPTKK